MKIKVLFCLAMLWVTMWVSSCSKKPVGPDDQIISHESSQTSYVKSYIFDETLNRFRESKTKTVTYYVDNLRIREEIYFPDSYMKECETQYDESGKSILEQCWSKDRNLKKSISYKDGLLEGPWQEWYDDGKMKTEKYFEHGLLNGPLTVWYENGSVSDSGTYINDQEVGVYTAYYENGQLKLKWVFAQDRHERIGPFSEWFESGGLRSNEELISLSDNKIKTCQKFFSEEGKVINHICFTALKT